MKKHLLFTGSGLLGFLMSVAQITTPVIRANFGVDADLRCNFFNGLVQSGNDDWFRLPGSTGTGQFIIDTAGAASLLAGYTSDPLSRRLPFYRTMRFPPYTTVNNRLQVDAVFVRDYHGDDSTIFATGSNKNGMSPAEWSCPVSQSIPDKNEILDMMLHVRRAGPTLIDSLWMFGGISIENTTGNRYFDFEMYQTDIYYDRASRRFYNYGPDAGHTSWEFNPVTGNMIKPGDIILTAEYSSSSLTALEPRIWVHISSLAIIPSGFDWTGTFDGANSGAVYGYAGIRPKTAGAFYTGLQSVANTWAGAFSLVLGDNSVLTTYTARQYMEFSVNLSKLGLDQAQIFGGDDCQMPFRRIIVKSRASTSFTAELKDFIAPFDFFLAPRAVLETETPIICDTGSISTIYVSNAIPTSIYQWTTPNGNIVGPTTGPSIVVDTPGVYIVTQYLQSGCSVYATDTITIASFGTCSVLENNLAEFRSTLHNRQVNLQWKVHENQLVTQFEVERSVDGIHFSSLFARPPDPDKTGVTPYYAWDDVSSITAPAVYYRLKLTQTGNVVSYSRVNRHDLTAGVQNGFVVYPNPVKDMVQMRYHATEAARAVLTIYDQAGRLAGTQTIMLQPGVNVFDTKLLSEKPGGVYQVILSTGQLRVSERIVLIK